METTVTLEHIPEPTFIPLGYSVGSSELEDGRTLEVVATGPALYFRISGDHAYVKLDVNAVAAQALAVLTGEVIAD